jgi:wyosine [tRNA(Phe)-imidazoG37] synthetase (radical SAM superfamily)
MKIVELPDIVQIETAMACNLRCPMCPVPESNSAMDGRKFGVMPLNVFAEIMNQISDKPRILGLTMMGEPLINKNIATFVRMAKERKHYVALTTNATLLTEKMSNDLLKAGLDMCKVSFDGATKETYQRIRIGADYNKVIQNVRRFAALRAKLKSTCQLQVHCIESGLTRHETKAFHELWKGIADETIIIGLNDWLGQFNLPPEFELQPSKPDAKLQPAKPDTNSVPSKGCHFLSEVLSISDNGQVVYCCFDYKRHSGLPNLMEKTLIDIWNDEISTERHKHLNTLVDSNPCVSCPHWQGIKFSRES